MAKASRVTELEAKVAALEAKLNFDDLTGCYSRQYLFSYFAHNAMSGCRLIFLDLDDFKSVNDHHGHIAGDTLLKTIAQTMISEVGDAGFVVRMSGDEFIIILYALTDAAFSDLERSLRSAISGVKLNVGGLDVSRSASFGFVTIMPDMHVAKAISMADNALLLAKSSGKNLSRGFEPQTSKKAGLLPSVDEVRSALKSDQIGYHVQPIANCRDLTVEGYEALIRWSKPSGVVLGPNQFLETMTRAYDAETLPPLAAARATSQWATQTMGKYISFNISEAFIERVATEGLDWVVEVVGDVPKDQIVFELLETMVERNSSLVHIAVKKLRSLGVRIALDDFGVGHSNLMRLQGLEIDLVKIDKIFIQGAAVSNRDQDLLGGLINLVHGLNIQTVIEGIETPEHLHIAQDVGASSVQGYFLGHPKPIGTA